ncbi:MAG: dihydropteroate synthase [Spirochaetaceae bacterium]|nr:dihydropteroate synthase [Spirochaetaceae bacterium]
MNYKPLPLMLASGAIYTDLPAFVMSIVNCTPDSFWAGSRSVDAVFSIEKALEHEKEGTHIIDLGAESSRPGSEYVSAQEEIDRLVPVIEGIRKYSSIPISVDTRKSSVLQAALHAGADILNDISALEDDDQIGPAAAAAGIPVILMHKRGNPGNMQKNTVYADVLGEVKSYLTQRCRYALSCGIKPEKIILDPGIGFGKDLQANEILIQHCASFSNVADPEQPNHVLIALSRKTCIGEITGRSVEQRLSGTICANLLAVQKGATIVRVHDTAETIDMLKVLRGLG